MYLDETSRGLTGNLALVVDLAPLGRVGDPADLLADLGALSKREMPASYAAPVTLRLRLPDGATDPAEAEVEMRFKLSLPSRIISEGGVGVRALAITAMASFERILASSELDRFRAGA